MAVSWSFVHKQSMLKTNCMSVSSSTYLVPEDPATGSGNGCLAGYLSHHCYYGSDVVDARVEQGYEIKRPSLLFLKAHATGETVEVHVGGQVVLVAHGTLI